MVLVWVPVLVWEPEPVWVPVLVWEPVPVLARGRGLVGPPSWRRR